MNFLYNSLNIFSSFSSNTLTLSSKSLLDDLTSSATGSVTDSSSDSIAATFSVTF